ncbi:DMT family transporter [Candidatus Aerophobetes bacterium]|nr:DMT family transporter [Candidatus Aerophobetes bacterium]
MQDKKAFFALILTVLVWGSSFAAIKVVLDEISPLGLSFLRSLLATVALLSLVGFAEGFVRLKKALREKFCYFIFLGATGVALFNILQNIGIQHTFSGVASVLLATNPIFVLLLGAIFLQERIRSKKLFGILLGFSGCALIIFGGKNITSFFLSGSFGGNLLVLLSALCWGLYVIMNKKILGEYSPLLLTTSAFIFGSLLLFLPYLFSYDVSLFLIISPACWLLVIYLGFISSGLTYLLWNYALKRLEASRASVFLFLVPVVAIILGKVLLAEKITLSIVTGAPLVFLGIYLVER